MYLIGLKFKFNGNINFSVQLLEILYFLFLFYSVFLIVFF
jgi:hypothetical protein